MLAWAFQVAVVTVVVAVVWYLVGNYQENAAAKNLTTGFGFLDQPSGFPIPDSTFRQTQRVRDALFEGFLNTLRLAVTGILLATVLGTLIGIARLSTNFVLRNVARAYVEIVRNVPLLALVLLSLSIIQTVFPPPQDTWDLGPLTVSNVRGTSIFWYEGDNGKFLVVVVAAFIAIAAVARWRRAVADRTGHPARTALWALPIGAAVTVVAWIVVGLGATAPELDGRRVTGGITLTASYLAALLALVAYTSSHIAEIVRGSIQAVPKGQGEAADALALSGFQRMWNVILPQSMRIGLLPIGNQYLNLLKNSSLAAVITFPELTQVTKLAVATRAPAVPSFVLLLLIYLAMSLVISLIVNLVNRRLRIVER
ncbi:MAG: ABC transporter permease subunit [Ilumatobacteraceae bacterium]